MKAKKIKVLKLADYLTEVDITHYASTKQLFIGNLIQFDFQGKSCQAIITELGNQTLRAKVVNRYV